MILNSGYDAFKKIALTKAQPFVDKTDFIARTFDYFNKADRFMVFSKPRRFGKTLTASMLSAYYSKGCDSREWFSNLKISKHPQFEEHLNKYNVLYIDMNSIKGKFDSYSKNERLHVEYVDDLVDFLQYQTVLELLKSNEFASHFEINPLEDNLSLIDCLTSIYDNTDTSFVLIMDEWDLIYRDYKDDHALQEKFIDLLRALFKSSEGAKCFSFVYLTGILPIKKYNSQSALNNFAEYNMLSPEPLENFFGFTLKDVKDLVSKRQGSVSLDSLRSWYDGYKLNAVEIFNPNSVCSALRDGTCKSYWSDTASFEQVQLLINMIFDGLRDDIVSLLSGNIISVDSSTFQNDLTSLKNKKDVLCLLICLGYFGCISTPNSSLKAVYIPNEEIRDSMQRNIMQNSWYKSMAIVERSYNLYEATVALDEKRVASIFNEIHNATDISVLAYNNEESLTYCILCGYSLSTADRYTARRQLQSGKGVADIIYEPNLPNLPILIVELKYGRDAHEAIEQIKDRNYAAQYMDKPNPIIIVGINYVSDPENNSYKEHECIIEKIAK